MTERFCFYGKLRRIMWEHNEGKHQESTKHVVIEQPAGHPVTVVTTSAITTVTSNWIPVAGLPTESVILLVFCFGKTPKKGQERKNKKSQEQNNRTQHVSA